MNTIDLETASNEIQQACEGAHGGGRLPYFFLIGAGVSSPPIKLASEIQDDCKTVALKYKRTGSPATASALDSYSYWFDKAYPQPSQRQKYLRTLIGGQPISQANFRLAHLLLEARIANLVITTNFDDFLSRALTLFGKQPIVCDHPDTVNRIDPEEREDIQIIHVHGSYWFYDCCNLSSEVKNRARSDMRSNQGMAALLESVLWRRMPLVLGYSGWEGDVVMTALERRLRNTLPNRLYWFCYRQDSIDSLPQWLKTHENVFFVVPQKTSEPAAEPAELNSPILTAPPAPDIKSKAKKGGDEAVLSAQDVLDKLIQTFELDAPPLTADPLGYFATYLRASLPQDDPAHPAKDLYFIKSVVERIERAREREEADRRTLRQIESKMEGIRDSLRRSQYREAINLAVQLDLDDMTRPQLTQLMEAIWSAATLLTDNSEDELRGYELAYDIYERLLDPALPGEGPDANQINRAARALLNRGITLGVMKKHDEEVAVYEKLIEMFGQSDDSQIRSVVADGLINKGLAFGELDRDQDEVAAYDEVVKLYSDQDDTVSQDHVMKALFNKSIVLGTRGDFEEAIRLSEDLIKRFSESDELSLREAAAQASLNKAIYLGKAKRHDDEILAYDEVVSRFWQASEVTQREQAAKALFNKIHALAKTGKTDAALAAADELVEKFGQASEPILRENVVQGMLAKGFYLRKQNEHARALEVFEDAIKRCAGEPEPWVQDPLATGMSLKAMALGSLGREEEAIAAFNYVVENFGASPEPAVRRGVSQALNGLGFMQLKAAKLALTKNEQADGSKRLTESQELFTRALEYSPDEPIIIGNQGYVAYLQGDKEKARELLGKAIEMGGELIRQIELQDALIHPLPQDKEFCDLVNSIPKSTSEDVPTTPN
ncbi:MAG TPA: tetratricopeptide repeat protein [Pyrinomonadaceae bacterium]|nr:tetratricopeptide repeat protein [Pyrinomonadaceae bacterium]